jgi:HD superfamily phosphohydrolase
MHTRFEHSLGVMHVATRLYDSILANSRATLDSEYGWNDDDYRRNLQLVRLAALLHDVGHSPFSHASEELFPFKEGPRKRRYKHEEYSYALIEGPLKDVIEKHPDNKDGILATEVAGLVEGRASLGDKLFWKDIIAGQLDADRMDYLNRDSHHIGVQYGRFDLNRVVGSMTAVPAADQRAARIGIQEGGWRAAESLILARYSMFTQVYFHKTRIIYDHHLAEAMKCILPGGCFPKPDALDEYSKWDDWKVQGHLSNGEGGEHGEILRTRNHYRRVYGNPESATNVDTMFYAKVYSRLNSLIRYEANPEKSWYKMDRLGSDIPVLNVRGSQPEVKPLSGYSRIVRSIEESKGEILLYVHPNDVQRAIDMIDEESKNV